ncbi:hypothetical protein [Paenibacillus sp. HW567]|uniref:hypothetical protein n=1 Tax=Paenibacillus sp. HW567 TaxID=1034769 RepID=UPI00035E1A6B|nr:hypothetical protein [Paenibacillus sp. HW567]
MIIQSGKIVIKSLQKGFMKGAKKLQAHLGRIFARFKFKKFKLERKGNRILLYGEVNPWVLLANGKIKEVDSLEGKKAGISTQAELDKIKSLTDSQRVDVYNKAVASKDGKIDFDDIEGLGDALEDTLKEVDYSSGRAYRNIEVDKIPIEYRADPRLVP